MQRKRFERKYLEEFVYGATDGTVTTFAVVAGAVGASLSSSIILILGFANLFADGFSMAISDYLAVKSEEDLFSKKRHMKNPRKTALVTFFSFAIIGFIPLISFVLAPIFPAIEANKFIYGAILTGLAFLLIGSIKAQITGKHFVYSAIETFVIGCIAALIAFAVGYFLKGLVQ